MRFTANENQTGEHFFFIFVLRNTRIAAVCAENVRVGNGTRIRVTGVGGPTTFRVRELTIVLRFPVTQKKMLFSEIVDIITYTVTP